MIPALLRNLRRRLCRAGLTLLPLALLASAATANDFDLAGPVLRVSVARGGVTLPLSQTPDLAVGDRLSIAVALPKQQGARYRLVLAFLRGATNPPPRDWLFDTESWKPKRATIVATVPEGAQQVLALLVPDTKGAVDAVSAAIRGRPGAFVRASQELNQAMLGSARLNAFADQLGRRDAADAAAVTAQLARSLGVKPDPACLQRQPDLRAGCLTQGSNVAVFADSQTNSIAQTLAGAPADIALQLSGTPQGGYGYYSPYIGVVRDLARILGAFQSAQLQFIPALSVQHAATTALLLNTVPSFRKPQSVLVAALPPVAAPALPPLEAGDRQALCLGRPDLLLPVSGAPLVFATDYARQVALRVRTADGRTLDLPVTADAAQGGYVLTGKPPAAVGAAATGMLHGMWGFTRFEGPGFRLTAATGAPWRLADTTPLVVGRDTPVTLVGGAAGCVAEVWMERDGARLPVPITQQDGDRLALKVPLAGIEPGPVTLLVRSYGVDAPQRLDLRALSEGSRLTGFDLHAGDREGVLIGTRLDQVATLALAGVTFRPQTLGRDGVTDRLVMTTDAAAVGMVRPGQIEQVSVVLADGRTVPLKVKVASARPTVALVGKAVEPAAAASPVPVTLTSPDIVAQNAGIVFSIKAQGDTRFTAETRVEIRATDPVVTQSLPLRLQDVTVGIATFVPEVALGGSAHGPLTFRVVDHGVASDWMPFAMLVRVPKLTALTCSATGCVLGGADLFLLRSVSASGAGKPDVVVPDGFAGATIAVPRATTGRLFVQLRDAPDAAASIPAPN